MAMTMPQTAYSHPMNPVSLLFLTMHCHENTFSDSDDDMAEDLQKRAPKSNEEQDIGEGQEDDEGGEGEQANEESIMNPSIKQEQDDDDYEDSIQPPCSKNNLSIILAYLQKCCEEATWLENNLDFHRCDKMDICKEHICETVTNLYQLFLCTMNLTAVSNVVVLSSPHLHLDLYLLHLYTVTIKNSYSLHLFDFCPYFILSCSFQCLLAYQY